MANVDSTLISNRAATPRVFNDPWTNAKMKTTGPGQMEVSTAEDSADILAFCQVKSNAVIHGVLVSSDAAITTGAMDVGLYQTADNGSAARRASTRRRTRRPAQGGRRGCGSWW